MYFLMHIDKQIACVRERNLKKHLGRGMTISFWFLVHLNDSHDLLLSVFVRQSFVVRWS